MPSVERNLIPVSRTSRRSQRVRIRLEAQASPLGGEGGLQPRALTIYNLSRDGFLIDANPDWTVGERLQISMEAVGPVEAVITRAEPDLFGCIFVRPLSAEELDRCTAASTVVWPDFVEPLGQDGRGAEAPLEADGAGFQWTEGAEEDAEERWPLRVRAAIAFGGGLLLWGLIALAIF